MDIEARKIEKMSREQRKLGHRSSQRGVYVQIEVGKWRKRRIKSRFWT